MYKIECECDICKQKESISMAEYTRISKTLNEYNYEYLCLDCKFDIMPSLKKNIESNLSKKNLCLKITILNISFYSLVI